MKLIRFGEPGKELPGVSINDKNYDVSAFVHDYDEKFFAAGGLLELENILERHANVLPEIPSSVRLGAPVARPSKIVCIGLNYADHAKETNAKLPPRAGDLPEINYSHMWSV